MGEQEVRQLDAEELKRFARGLLGDVDALEAMLQAGAIQSGHRRIGCEQEMFLLDRSGRPRPVALELIEALGDSHFTTELGRFNLEVNQDSLAFEGDCLSRMEAELWSRLERARETAARLDTQIILTGILPTLRKSDLGLDNLTPLPRYRSLNSAMEALSGGSYELHLEGADELIVRQDSVMMESCCTSFQIHYQTDPEDFVNVYNVAQAVTAPLLAAAVNSPMLFGRKLWQETRIPLFQQSIDTRRAAGSLRERSARVTFGERWLEGSVVELFRDQIARFPILLGTEVDEDSLGLFMSGELPRLRALQVHNGTIYRWNRPCYGLSEGVAHLRIENRVLPSGPTVRDEVANAAFFYGLLYAMPRLYPGVDRVMEFEHAQLNFNAAARTGLDSQFRWLGGASVSARELILRDLLPLARQGLSDAGLAPGDVTTYLDVIGERVSCGATGAAWIARSMASLREKAHEAGRETSLAALTTAIVDRQWTGTPVHQWTLAAAGERRPDPDAVVRVEEAMSTRLLTVRPEEPVAMARCLMEWKRIHHLPVEDASGELRGVLSLDRVLAHFDAPGSGSTDLVSVDQIMDPNPQVIGPEESVGDAVGEMASRGVDYLIVVEEGRIAGILTEPDVRRVDPDLFRHNRFAG